MEKPNYKIVRQNANWIGIALGMHLLTAYILSAFLGNLFIILEIFAGIRIIEGTITYEVFNIILYLISIVPAYLIVGLLRGLKFKDIVGDRKSPARAYILAILLCAGISVISSFLGGVIEISLNTIGLTEIQSEYILPTTIPAAIFQFIGLAVVPPIVEELCFRGVVFKEASKTASTFGAAFVSSLVFCIAHKSLTIIPLAMLFGIFACYLREKYGSILPAMVGHATVNGIYFILNYFTYNMSIDQVGNVMLFVNGIMLAMGAIGIIIFCAQDGFAYDSMFSFSKRSKYGAFTSIMSYITSIPFILMLIILIYGTVLNLGVL